MDPWGQSNHQHPLLFSNKGLGEGISRKAEKNLVLCQFTVYSILSCSAFPCLSYSTPNVCCCPLPSVWETQRLANPALIHSWYKDAWTLSPKNPRGCVFFEWLERVNYCNGGKQGCDWSRKRRSYTSEEKYNRKWNDLERRKWTRKEDPNQPLLLEQVRCSLCQNSFGNNISVSFAAK